MHRGFCAVDNAIFQSQAGRFFMGRQEQLRPKPEEGMTTEERESLIGLPQKDPLAHQLTRLTEAETVARQTLGGNFHVAIEQNQDGTQTVQIGREPRNSMKTLGAVRIVSPEFEIFNNLVRRRRI